MPDTPPSSFHRNQQLFSDYYLNEILPVRADWEAWLTAQKAKHDSHTAQIVAGEIALNARVYSLFGLTPEEITVIEDSTKYRYGEV